MVSISKFIFLKFQVVSIPSVPWKTPMAPRLCKFSISIHNLWKPCPESWWKSTIFSGEDVQSLDYSLLCVPMHTSLCYSYTIPTAYYFIAYAFFNERILVIRVPSLLLQPIFRLFTKINNPELALFLK